MAYSDFAGSLTGGGLLRVANVVLGRSASGFTGDFTILEDARITASDGSGNMLNSAFGGNVTLPKRAVVCLDDNCPNSGVAIVNAASFDLPSDFDEWYDQKGYQMSVRVVNGTQLRMRKRLGVILIFR